MGECEILTMYEEVCEGVAVRARVLKKYFFFRVPVYLAFVLVTFTSAIFKPDCISQNTFFGRH